MGTVTAITTQRGHSQLDISYHVMTDPVISSVQTINPQDFDSISDEVTDDRDDVVYMRLGVEPGTHHMGESGQSQHWNNPTQSNDMMLQLKTQIKTEKKESTALKEGFYHPT